MGLTDTVTVTAEIPVVDVHTAKHELTLSGEVVRAMSTVADVQRAPAAHSWRPPTSTTQSPGRRQPRRPFRFTAAGPMRGVSQLDGLTIGSPPSGNSAASYVVDVGNAQEVTFTTAGGLGESETAGLVMKIVPKNGGNTTHGSLFASSTGATLQSSNLTSELEARGFAAATPLPRSTISRRRSAVRSSAIGSGNSSTRTPAAAPARARPCTTTSTPAIRASGCTRRISAAGSIRIARSTTRAGASPGS